MGYKVGYWNINIFFLPFSALNIISLLSLKSLRLLIWVSEIKDRKTCESPVISSCNGRFGQSPWHCNRIENFFLKLDLIIYTGAFSKSISLGLGLVICTTTWHHHVQSRYITFKEVPYGAVKCQMKWQELWHYFYYSLCWSCDAHHTRRV